MSIFCKYRSRLHEEAIGFPNYWYVQSAFIGTERWTFVSGYYRTKDDADSAIRNKDFYGLFHEPWLSEQVYTKYVIKEYRIDRSKRSFDIPGNHTILSVRTDEFDIVFCASVYEESVVVKKNFIILKTGDELEYGYEYGCSFDDLGVKRHVFYEQLNDSY